MAECTTFAPSPSLSGHLPQTLIITQSFLEKLPSIEDQSQTDRVTILLTLSLTLTLTLDFILRP